MTKRAVGRHDKNKSEARAATSTWVITVFSRTLRLALTLITAATIASAQQTSIAGTVVDATSASIAGAQVKLSIEGSSAVSETRSDDGGGFVFAAGPGVFHLTFTAKGFAVKTVSGELHAGEALSLPPTMLDVDSVTTDLNVTQTQAEIAQAQIKAEEKQRLIGIVPNYFVAYEPDAAPLNTKQKFELSWKTWLDPTAFAITGIIAGVGQVRNTNRGFGQGAQGYAKRYAAGYADFVTSTALANFVLPTLFHQDPRYFYRGTGTVGSRFRYALSRAVMCRGDNGKSQLCYSSLISGFASAPLTNLYLPKSDRNSNGATFENAAIGLGAQALGNLFQEFVARKLTPKKH